MESLVYNKEVSIAVDSVKIKGHLSIPDQAQGIVLFSHGSGSSRFSPRNKYVAKELQKRNLATFLFDLLTVDEDLYYNTRFNIELLTKRLLLVCNWIQEYEPTQHLEIGLFGSSTGAASAIGAAAMMGELVKAVVSRGGRPDLAFPYLEEVKAATLFLVGGRDIPVIELNEEAFKYLGSEKKKMVIVQGATHLFEENGKLEEVAKHAADWFGEYLK